MQAFYKLTNYFTMPASAFIPVPNDMSVTTLYYETLYNIVGQNQQTQVITNSPLPDLTLVSPWGVVPYVEITPLPDATAYQYQMRRFDASGNYSPWTTGTFTTP